MKEIGSKIESIENQINLVQENVNFSLGLTWAILSVLVAVIALTSFVSIKGWFDKRFNEEAKRIDQRVLSFLKDNPQILWARMNGTILSSKLIDREHYKVEHEYLFTGFSSFSKENIIYVDAYYYVDGKKIAIDDRYVDVTDTSIKVIIHDQGFQPNIQVYIFAMWTNPIYQLNDVH
jgi:hypothetical protein